MDFWQIVVVVVRRWYVAMPAFLTTVGLAAVAYSSLPVQYQSGSVLVVTTSLTGRTEQSGHVSPALTNPLLNFDRNVTLTTSILIQQMNSPEMADALGVSAIGPTTYRVTNGSTNPELLQSGPLLFVQGTGPDPEAAERITKKANDMAAQVLASRQTDLEAPASTYMGLTEVVQPTAGERLTTSPSRAAVAAGTLACLAGLLAALGFDRLIAQRGRTRSGGRTESTRR
jgi:hypothetical protein